MKRILDRIAAETQGELSTEAEDLDYYSTDGSIFTITPTAVFYPKDTIDVQHLVRVVHEAANEGHYLPIIARGRGTDQAGGPLGNGIIVDFTRHMNHILEIGNNYVVVQPGTRYGHLQDELRKRGQYIPAYPASVEICAIGGAVANNSAGEKTVKYGDTRHYVSTLKVVLSNGELIQTERLDNHQAGAKKRQDDMEGHIYRELDDILDSHAEFIKAQKPHVTKNSAGYALWEVQKYNKFDLSKIIVGSQGTLGLVTEIRLHTMPVPQNTVLSVSYYDDIQKSGYAVKELKHLNPSALEVVDSNLISMVLEQNPELLKGLLPRKRPAIILLTEFDDPEKVTINKKLQIAEKIFDKYAYHAVQKSDPEEQQRLWKLRRSAAAVMWTIPGSKKALPIIEDGVVHPSLLSDFFERAYALFEKYGLDIAVWGHAGDANLHMQPFMDLGKKADRDKIFNVTDEFYQMIIELGGSTSAEHNDGLMRSPYLPLLYGDKMMELFEQVKNIFDPYNLFNPHKKVGVTKEFVKKHLRREYSIKSLQRKEQVDR